MANERFEIEEEVLESIAGGNIQYSAVTNRVRNTTTGLIYNVADGVDSDYLYEWVLANHARLGDNGCIEEMLANKWIY